MEQRSSALPVLSDLTLRILQPQAPPVRRVGPGRLERGYQARVEALEQLQEASRQRERELEGRVHHAAGELLMAERLERSLQRLADRQEERLELAAQREKRLALALGAVQRENELLRARLELPSGPAARQLEAGRPARKPRAPRRGLWARLFARS